jgi:hypothetical protein
MDLKICIATHKKFDPPKEDFFVPIQVGKAINEDLDYQGDDTLDSISAKNPNYCELTALYWAWKNLDYDVLGLCHYRRYFDIENRTDRVNDLRFISQNEFEQSRFPKEKIRAYLKKYDVILPKPKVSEYSIAKNYASAHIEDDYKILTELLEEMYPEYAESWHKVSHFTNKLIHYNMLIASKDIANAYCEWLFSILFEVEKRIKFSPYAYQQRVIGFMAERLMTLYFTHHNFKIKYLPVMFVKDENFHHANPSKLSKRMSNWYKNFLFFLATFPRKLKSSGA